MKSDADLALAFAADGLEVERIERLGTARGILASSLEDRARKVLYLEGSPRAQGYLAGLLAGDAVERMAGEFVDNVVGAFIAGGRARPLRLRRLKRQLLDLLRDRCLRTYYRRPGDIPVGLREEMKGIAAGCRSRNPRTLVSYRELFLLNTGIDLLLSYAYSGAHRMDWIPDVRRLARRLRGRSRLARRLALLLAPRRPAPRGLRMPLGCNAFSISSSLTEGARRYLGRDFMFPTAGVFHDTCCLVVRVPEEGRIPSVSVAAPGLVGCVTAVNAAGIGLGVDMVPGGLADFHHPGLNSLLLLREVAEVAGSLEQAVERIREAPRGVPWLYVVADGDRDEAVVVEAGARDAPAADGASIPEPYRAVLASLPLRPAPEGAVVRQAGFRPPAACAELNGRLFEAAGLRHRQESEAPEGRFHTAARRPWRERAVPGPFYFAPARLERTELLVAGNQYLTPEMRLTSMGAWISLVAGGHEDDAQWRSDELCSRLREAVELARRRGSGITLEEARAVLDFLSPIGAWPEYYAKNARTPRGKRIEGALALCDLTARAINASFGAYDGIWVRLDLPAYVPASSGAPAPTELASRGHSPPKFP